MKKRTEDRRNEHVRKLQEKQEADAKLHHLELLNVNSNYSATYVCTFLLKSIETYKTVPSLDILYSLYIK